MNRLSKKQRLIFNEWWAANQKWIKRGKYKKTDLACAWKDGIVYGKHGHKWKR